MARMAVFNKFRLISLAAALIVVMGLVTACGEPSGGATGQATPTPTAVNTVQPTPTTTAVATAQPAATPDWQNVVEVIYTHRTHRCASCLWAEDWLRWTVDTYFAEEMADGKLVFMSIDIEDSNNSALANKLGAYASQIFINKIVDGEEEIDQLTSLYYLVGDSQAYSDKAKAEIEERLE